MYNKTLLNPPRGRLLISMRAMHPSSHRLLLSVSLPQAKALNSRYIRCFSANKIIFDETFRMREISAQMQQKVQFFPAKAKTCASARFLLLSITIDPPGNKQ
jgi:hypothetical protein